ncbi:zinc ribbon domain-containing protein [Anaerotalea alkaliphila]|uniref:Zinc ribbon domain-containing protein n=1 Tax=Anaerotalea alkaliphila TaxID=2662126 RepID=A0A7X5HVB2_9FIRM|nr:zinc ribbon domain-containing protein [Anaerotalea alkaliphila]NDL67311.1 zinc ribbon domain-containing protein [Anaerotalea alkaliphila]
MYCEECGAPNPDEALFCANCGTKFVKAEGGGQEPVEAPKPQAASQQVPPPVPPPQPWQQTAPPPVAPPQPRQEFQGPSGGPGPGQYGGPDLNAPMGVGSWLAVYLLMAVPILNIVLIFKWAFGNNVNRNKKNFAIAALILFLISLVLSILFFIFFGEFFYRNMGGAYY